MRWAPHRRKQGLARYWMAERPNHWLFLPDLAPGEMPDHWLEPKLNPSGRVSEETRLARKPSWRAA
jgi:hypothetical protein